MAGFAAIITGIWNTVKYADRLITLTLNSYHLPVTDMLWRLLSNKLCCLLILLACILYFIKIFGWRKALFYTAGLFVALLLCQMLSDLSKVAFERLRPCWDRRMISAGLRILEDRGGFFGFFSSHAAVATAISNGTYLILQKDLARTHYSYGRLMAIWSVFVGFSRIFLGKNFLLDVIVGLFVGFVVSGLMIKLTSFLWNRTLLRRDRTHQV